MAILTEVKTDLRITGNSFDGELSNAIEAVKHQLHIAGVEVVSENDPLTMQAIKLYCRYWMNFQGDAERYKKAFDEAMGLLALSQDYKT